MQLLAASFLNTAIISILVYSKSPVALPLLQRFSILNGDFEVPTHSCAHGTHAQPAEPCLLTIAVHVCALLWRWHAVQDFTSQWYSNVGVAIVATVAIQVVTMHALPVFNSYVRFPIRRACCRNRAVTQRDLVRHASHCLSQRA